MGQVNLPVRQVGHGLWLGLIRLQQRLGATGLVGLGLLAVAAAVAVTAWSQHREFRLQQATTAVSPAEPALPPSAPMRDGVRPPTVRWPSAKEDVTLLLARIERTAVERGLGWPQAEYRFTAATGEAPDNVEVRCALKGPYRSVRAFVTALLMDTPTLTLREFSVSRANSDAAAVEAKLSIVVYLRPGFGGEPEPLR